MTTIIIDPGHGGDSDVGGSTPYGARGALGTREKDVTLELARRVGARLSAGARTVLTRQDDRNLSMAERAELARRHDADVFVSIHANEGAPGQRGGELYVHDAANASSRVLAQSIGRRLGGRGEPAAPVRSGDLTVLRPRYLGQRTAACLVEVDYLSDPDRERKLRSPAGLDSIADAIATGIHEYFGGAAAHARGGAPVHARAQEGAAATIVAAVGVGYTIAKDLFTAGDVTYELNKMQGAKYPWDRKEQYEGPAFREGAVIDAHGWFQTWQGDEIGLWFDVKWNYNGHAVGDVEMLKRRVEGPFTKWRLKVESSLIPETAAYKRSESAPPYARIRLTNTYEWSHWIWDSMIAREVITLDGDGRWYRSFTWVQG